MPLRDLFCCLAPEEDEESKAPETVQATQTVRDNKRIVIVEKLNFDLQANMPRISTYRSKTTFNDLDDDCLALIVGKLDAADRLRLEPVCHRFQKCMFRVVDSLTITFSPIKFGSTREGEWVWLEHCYNCSLQFNDYHEKKNVFLQPSQFRALVSKVTGRVMQLSVSFDKVTDEMLDTIENINYHSLKVSIGDITKTETELLFGSLGCKIHSLSIDESCEYFDFKPKWTLKWFQAGDLQQVTKISFITHHISRYIEEFDQAWQTTLSEAKFRLLFRPEANLKISFWLRQRIDDVILEVLFEDAFAELSTFTNLRKLKYCCVFQNHLPTPTEIYAAFQALSSGCQKFRTLVLSFSQCHESHSWHLFKALLESLAYFPDLKIISFSAQLGDLNDERNTNQNEIQDGIFQTLAMSRLKTLEIKYYFNCNSKEWRKFGKHLPRTLREFRFIGQADMVDNLVGYNSSGHLEKIALFVKGDLNETAMIDFVDSTRNLKDIQIKADNWVMSSKFTNAFKEVRKPNTKVDIWSRKRRLMTRQSTEH